MEMMWRSNETGTARAGVMPAATEAVRGMSVYHDSLQRAALCNPGATGFCCQLTTSCPGTVVIHYLNAACLGIPIRYEERAALRAIRNKKNRL